MNIETPRIEIPLPGGGVMAFRNIPAGEFWMGSRGEWAREEPRHRVRIEHDFWLGETPVTQWQFGLWTEAEKVEHKNGFPGNPEHPAENMDWREAVWFCAWLTRKVREKALPKGGFSLFCLPTEAEWEYACRALGPGEGHRDREYHTGDGAAALRKAGWFDVNSENSTRPAGQLEPNRFGLYDMHGNVWEWCHDGYNGTAYREAADGDADPGFALRNQDYSGCEIPDVSNNQTRVLRGGSWISTARNCRSACRFRWWPGDRDWSGGFRVCLVRGPAARSGAIVPEGQTAEPGRNGRVFRCRVFRRRKAYDATQLG